MSLPGLMIPPGVSLCCFRHRQGNPKIAWVSTLLSLLSQQIDGYLFVFILILIPAVSNLMADIKLHGWGGILLHSSLQLYFIGVTHGKGHMLDCVPFFGSSTSSTIELKSGFSLDFDHLRTFRNIIFTHVSV